MNELFISYSRRDGDFAVILRDRLRQADLPAWMDMDRLQGGEEWRKEIDQAILEASAVLVVMSPAARASEYVTYEWAFALGAGVKVIPILIEPVELHPRLAVLQFLDFTRRERRPWDGLLSLLNETRDIMLPVVRRAAGALQATDPGMRLSAVRTLAGLDHPAAREALAKALGHQFPDVRWQAALSLAELKDARAEAGLIDILSQGDPSLWEATAQALQQIGRHSAVPELIQVLYSREEAHPHVLQVLETIGSPAVPGLAGLLQDESAPTSARSAAAASLGEIQDRQAVPVLIRLLKDRQAVDKIRMACAAALGRLDDPEAVSSLLEVFAAEEEDTFVREKCALALGQIGDPSAVPTLISALTHHASNIWQSAARALVWIGTPEAMAAVDAKEERVLRRYSGDERGQEHLEAFFLSLRREEGEDE